MKFIHACLLANVKERNENVRVGNGCIPCNILFISGGLINSEPLPPLPSPQQFSSGQKATYPPAT